MYQHCSSCAGSGQLMGGGMMMMDCRHCEGRGKVYIEPTSESLLKKEDKRYQDAISKIKALDPTITDEEAEEMFKKELANLDKTEESDDKQINGRSPKKARKKH